MGKPFRLAMVILTAGAAFIGRPSPAAAVKVVDITRLSGQHPNTIIGLGLVVGLKGTGDGGDYLPAMKPMLKMLETLRDQSELKDLANAQNIALVAVTAVVPPDGAKIGDTLDVRVASIGGASSLAGGTLMVCPLTDSTAKLGIFAMASGSVELEDNAEPNHGVIKGGAVMEQDWGSDNITDGKFTLIIDNPSAGWINASVIAQMINDAEGNGTNSIAVAKSPKTVEVTIPQTDAERPDNFIRRVQQLPVPQVPTEARVQINVKAHTLIISGDVEISPVVISHEGLTITVASPPPQGTTRNPVVTEKNFLALDTSGTGGAKLQDLINALDQWRVPIDDRIKIVMELHKMGKLHAQLLVE